LSLKLEIWFIWILIYLYKKKLWILKVY
jgi:hypothetical protein